MPNMIKLHHLADLYNYFNNNTTKLHKNNNQMKNTLKIIKI